MSEQIRPIHADFAARLREARFRAGLTQRHLSDALGISHTQVARYERGMSLPRPGIMLRMAECLGVPLEHLTEDAHIQLVQLERSDGSNFATVSFSDGEFAEITRAAQLSGIPVEDVIKNIILTGMGKTGLNRMK